jgi:hypothetical protein
LHRQQDPYPAGQVLAYSVDWYRQKKPFDRVLPYDKVEIVKAYTSPGVPLDTHYASTYLSYSELLFEAAGSENPLLDLAYERLKDKVSNTASVGVSLAEAGQSIKMIENRALQLARFARKLRRGDPIGAAKELGLYKKHLRKKEYLFQPKEFPKWYLEFHFGWAPLVGDIFNAIDFLQQPLKAYKVVGGAKDETFRTFGDFGPGSTIQEIRARRSIRMGARVRIDNPNLYLANQLGLTNPAVVLWELVPYSFVVDWFINVGDVLQQMTDFLGLEVTLPYTTRRQVATYTLYTKDEKPFSTVVFNHFRLHRKIGLDKPSLMIRPYKVPGLRRAAAAISLLLLRLK